MANVWFNCASTVHTAITGLTLTGITVGNRHLLQIATDRPASGVTALPAVIVSIPPLPPTELPGTNERDDWGYPVHVTIVDVANQVLTLVEQRYDWIQVIRRHFHHKRLTGVTEVYVVRVEPGPAYELDFFLDKNLWVHTDTIRCVTREVRT